MSDIYNRDTLKPHNNKTKYIRITFRLDAKLKEKIKSQSEKSNLSMSEYICKILSNRNITVIEEGRNIFFELNKIGNNLNQIAKKLNAGIGTEADLKELSNISRGLDKIWQSLNSLM